VTGDDVPNDEMPNILRPGRRDVLPPSDAALAALFAGTEPLAEPAPGLRPVADLLAALRADATGAELAGEAWALAEFRRGTGAPARPRRSRHRRPHVLPSRVSAKATAAMGIAALGLGGLATAAVIGALPPPVQQIAHRAFGAPAAHSGGPRARTQVPLAERHVRASPQATDPVPGSAVHGLWWCTAYARARAHGTPWQVIAYRHLIKAAGGAGKVTAYCGRPTPAPAYHPGRQVPPNRRDRRFPHHQAGRGIPPRGRRGHQGQLSKDRPSAHPAERRGKDHRPHAPGNDAQMNPTRHRAVTRSQLGRVGPRHRSEG
jgi:hypothetical protein